MPFDPEFIIPLAAVVMIFGIPIVAILTGHQRKMAEIMRGNQTVDNSAHLAREFQMLREEVRTLRDQVNRQALALDDRGVQPLTPDYDATSLGNASAQPRQMPPDLPQNR
ncbi:MAG: hypothetical protein JNJ45_11255 [Chthonomonas sp.]|nr:hypothetical protein [Chthonomonas sp.]